MYSEAIGSKEDILYILAGSKPAGRCGWYSQAHSPLTGLYCTTSREYSLPPQYTIPLMITEEALNNHGLGKLFPLRMYYSAVCYRQEGVDVRSCILSLVDLFSHWLSQPLHTHTSTAPPPPPIFMVPCKNHHHTQERRPI